MVHVSAGPPALPHGGLAPVRGCPWLPVGRLPLPRAAAALPPRHPAPAWFAATGAPGCAGPPGPGTPGTATGPEPLGTRKGCPRPAWGLAPWPWAFPPLQRSSGLLRQSCTRLVSRASPPHQVWAGGGQPRRGAGPARRGLGAACPACVAPAPGGACGACPRCCPHDRGLPRVRHGSARRKARPALAVRRPSRGCRHARLFRPAGVRATPSTPPAPACTVGPPCLFPPSRSRVVTAPCPGDATRRHRAMDGMGTCTPSDAQPCRRLPERRA